VIYEQIVEDALIYKVINLPTTSLKKRAESDKMAAIFFLQLFCNQNCKKVGLHA
jgi:RNase H-fold protein (predicted Holliday junction resolvase)